MREPDVRDKTASEERADASLGAIEKLIGNDDVERFEFLFQAADRARRENALDAEDLEAVDVRAEIQLGGQQRVAGAVTGEKGHALPAKRADEIRSRRIAERRRDLPFAPVGELRHVVEAAPPDYSDVDSATRLAHIRVSLCPL